VDCVNAGLKSMECGFYLLDVAELKIKQKWNLNYNFYATIITTFEYLAH